MAKVPPIPPHAKCGATVMTKCKWTVHSCELFLCVVGFVTFYSWPSFAERTVVGTSVDPYKITSEAVGGITAGTAISRESFTNLFPLHEVKAGKSYAEGSPAGEMITVYKNKKVVLEANSEGLGSTRLFAVQVRDPNYMTPARLHVGAKVANLFGRSPKPDCLRGFEETDAYAFCLFRDPPNVLYKFRLTKKELLESVGPNRELKLNDAKGRKIEAILWKPQH